MQVGVRLLPNAVTVLALCSGLSAVYFAMAGHFELSVAAGAIAAVFDALDGRLARLLDASSRIGAELDSLSDLVSFGVSPALVLYIWPLHGTRLGWVVALVFAVCMALRLARFNTLLDADDQPPYAKEFFVGVPAPAAALLGGAAAVRDPAVRAGLVVGPGAGRGVGGVRRGADGQPAADAVVQERAGAAAARRADARAGRAGRGGPGDRAVPGPGRRSRLIYLRTSPTRSYRTDWLSRHPEAWNVPVRQRRAVARAARSARRLGLRPPLRRGVAGRASAVARAVRRFGDDGGVGRTTNGAAGPGPAAQPNRNRLRLGLRRARRR